MKKVYAGDGVRTITMIHVRIEFSREIAHLGDKFYYQNAKFMEWWDTKFYDYCRRHFDTCIWQTAYCNSKCQERAEKGELDHSVVRYLHTMDDCSILIQPTMSAFLFYSPSEFATTHEVGLAQLSQICHACAKYCGGTVKITYSSRQHRFIWDDTDPKEIELGTGHSDLIKPKEPKRTKKAVEAKHTWEENPKKEK